MLGRYVSDLEVGDILGPVDYVATRFLIREYAHAVEDVSDRYHGADGLIAPPTIIHTDKKRLLDHACPEGPGPVARLHLIYDATHHRVIPAEQSLSVVGQVSDRFERKGREHIVMEFQVRDKATGELYTTYRDTSLLGYRAKG